MRTARCLAIVLVVVSALPLFGQLLIIGNEITGTPDTATARSE